MTSYEKKKKKKLKKKKKNLKNGEELAFQQLLLGNWLDISWHVLSNC